MRANNQNVKDVRAEGLCTFGGDGPDEWAEFEHKPKVRRRACATLVSIDRSLPKQNLSFQDDQMTIFLTVSGRFRGFEDVRKEIEAETIRACGAQRALTPKLQRLMP